MAELDMAEVRQLLKKQGATKRQRQIGAAIAMCEAPVFGSEPPRSNFGAVGDQALADDTWGYSYGGFQVRSLREHKGTGKYRDEERLLNPEFNVASAYKIFKQRGDWTAWSTFTTGMHKAYLPDLYPPAPGTYVVKAGETLGRVAQELGISWEELARVDGIHSPYTIFIGQVLTLP